MSLHFSANQFEREFNPKRLGNWEVPKWFPERPRRQLHKTRIIADDRGHLLPGVPRISDTPWEKYVTAWDFPRKITRTFGKPLTPCSGAQEVTARGPRKAAAWADRQPPLPDSQSPKEGAGGRTPEAPRSPSPPEEAESGGGNAEAAVTRSGREGRERRHRRPSATARGEPGGALEAPEEEERASPPPPKTPTPPEATTSPKAEGGNSCEGGELVEEAADRKAEQGEWEYPERSEITDQGMESKRKSGSSEGEGGLEVMGTALTRGSTPSSAGHHPKAANGKSGKEMPPLATAYTPFFIAKQCAEENLRHQPLPDMVEDPNYQLMESQGAKHPGVALPVAPQATAVSIRQKRPGPTHCTKSSIFRTVKPPDETALTSFAPLGGKHEERATKAYKPKITDMDLAIGWDIYAPIKSEGHHQSLGTAPSVFTVVPPPSPLEGNCGLPGGCGTPSITASQNSHHAQRASGIENAPCSSKQSSLSQSKPSSPPFPKASPSLPHSKSSPQQSSKLSTPLNPRTPITSKPPTPQNSRYPQSRNRGSLSSWDLNQRPAPRKAWEENDSPNPVTQSPNQFLGNEIRNCMSNNPHQPHKVNPPRKRRSHSSPNLTRNPQLGSNVGAAFHKACTACHDNTKPHTSPKNSSESSGYKMAFKAGKPSSNRPMTAHPSGGSGSTSSITQGEAPKVKVPKPRAPYARRSYSIGTLAPPFSLWPGNHKRGGREYPDHWRLASVYQHAYKPIHNRTRPLLATVYQ